MTQASRKGPWLWPPADLSCGHVKNSFVTCIAIALSLIWSCICICRSSVVLNFNMTALITLQWDFESRHKISGVFMNWWRCKRELFSNCFRLHQSSTPVYLSHELLISLHALLHGFAHKVAHGGARFLKQRICKKLFVCHSFSGSNPRLVTTTL